MQLAFFTHRFIFTILLIHVSFLSFSQKNDFAGFYINQQGDTVKGSFGHYKQWLNNPNRVSFTPLQTGNSIELTPATCKEFYVDNYDTYVAYVGERLTNPINMSGASSVSSENTKESISTFLRQIAVTGQYKFFMFRDQLRINLFYSDNNNVITELQQKAAVINDVFWQSMTYQQQLKVLFTTEKQQKAIADIHYTEESLVAFLNEQTGDGRSKRVRNKNNGLYIAAGISMNSFKFTSVDNALDFTSRDFPSKTVPVAAIGYIFNVSRNFDRLFFFPQIKIFSFKHSASVSYNNGTYPAFYDTFQSSPVMSLDFHLGYNLLNNPNLKISLSPGFGLMYMGGNKQIDENRNSATNSTIVTTSMNSITSLVDIQAMAIFSKKFVLWTSYNLPATVTDFATTKGRVTSIQAGVGYKF